MANKPSFKDIIRYHFDTIMAKGTGALIAALGVLSLLLITVGALIVAIGGTMLAPLSDGEPQPISFFEAFWMSLMRTLDAGTMGSDEGWGFRIIMLGITIGGIFIVSTLIGILASGLESRLEELRKGRSKILEQGHTLILGWAPQVFTIVQELVYANANQKKAVIAILAEKDKVEMEDELKARITKKGCTKILCRTGSPMDIAEIEIANPYTTKSIIILPPEDTDPDTSVIKTVLAITNNPDRRREPYHIVTHIQKQETQEILKMLGKHDCVQAVVSGDLIARFIAQTTRHVGLSSVYSELFDFEGDEIYMQNEPLLSGKTYRDAALAYDSSCIIGIQKDNGSIMLNPPAQTVIESHDRIIAISEDDDTIILAKDKYSIDEKALNATNVSVHHKPESFLLLGWNSYTDTIIRELDNYVSEGSTMLVLANPSFCAHPETFSKTVINLSHELHRLTLTYKEADTCNRKLLDSIHADSYDHVIVLGYDGIDINHADSKTLVTLLHLRDIAEHDDTPFSIISEMFDVRNRELASITGVDDFVVSNHLISLLMAQLSENKDLLGIYSELFNAEGNEVYLKPITNYIDISREVNFYTCVEAALKKGETAIGYRLASQAHNPAQAYGVITNPLKHEYIKFSEHDKLIVIAEGE